MAKQMLNFDKRNLIPPKEFKAIKDSGLMEIFPYKAHICVHFSTVNAIDKGFLSILQNEGDHVVAEAEKKITKRLQDLLKTAAEQHKKDQNNDPKACDALKKEIKKCIESIEDIAGGMPQDIRKMLERILKANLKNKTNTVSTLDFLSPGDGIRIKRGVFNHISADDSGDELNSALDRVKRNSSAEYEFVFIDGKDDGLEIKRRIQGGDIKAAKEQAGGSGKQFRGDVTWKDGIFYFELSKDCSKGTRQGLAKDIRTLVKEKCKRVIKVVVDNEDKAEDE